MQIIFLGTSCMVPTKERNVSGIYLEYEGEGILVDCGEGTQRQLNIAGIPRNRVKKILISHFHGDHMAGLIGLMQTMGNEADKLKLSIYGPKGTKKFMDHLLKCCYYDMNMELNIEEINPEGVETFYENDCYILQAVKLDHNVECIGFSFVEKDKRRVKIKELNEAGIKSGPLVGKLQKGNDVLVRGKKVKAEDVTFVQRGRKISFILDTVFTESAIKLAEDSDVMISEAAYTSKLEEKAEKYKHMTAKQAAYIANVANAKRLILTHISQRYKTSDEILDDAKQAFDNVEVAYDFMKIKV